MTTTEPAAIGPSATEDADLYADAAERALERPLHEFEMHRTRPGLTTDVPAVTWVNDVAFLAIVFEPRGPFVVYVGRLIDGEVPAYPAGAGGTWDYLDLDFFFEAADLPLPTTDHVPARSAAHLGVMLEPYATHLAAIAGRTLSGDLSQLDRLISRARSVPDDDE